MINRASLAAFVALLVCPTSSSAVNLITTVAALETCLESGAAGQTVACEMDAGTYALGAGLVVDAVARAVLVCPFGPHATVFTISGSGVAIGKGSGSGSLEVEGCGIRDVGSATGTIALDRVGSVRRVRVDGFIQSNDVGFRPGGGTIDESWFVAKRPIDASTGAGDLSIVNSSFYGGSSSNKDWCVFAYDSAAGNPQVFMSGNTWSNCKGFQIRTEGTWHMIDELGFRLGSGGTPSDAIFNGAANDFRVRIRAKGKLLGSSDAWNSINNVLIFWRTAPGGSNLDDATSFDFELFDADSCPAIGLNGGTQDDKPVIEWENDPSGWTLPTFHHFRLILHSDFLTAAPPPARITCDRPHPFGPDLLAGWLSSADGHFTQGLYRDSLWRIEVKDGLPQRTLPNTGQMAPPRSCDVNLEAPSSAQDGHAQCRIPTDARLARVSCSTTTGTATINLYERSPASPNSGTADLLVSDLVCDADGESVECDPVATNVYCSPVFTDGQIDEGNLLALGVKATSGAGHLRVHAEWY